MSVSIMSTINLQSLDTFRHDGVAVIAALLENKREKNS